MTILTGVSAAVCPTAPPHYNLRSNMNWNGGAGTSGGHTSPQEAQRICNSNPKCIAWNSYGYYLIAEPSFSLTFSPYGGLCVYVKDAGKSVCYRLTGRGCKQTIVHSPAFPWLSL
jgi:hypothetical protein